MKTNIFINYGLDFKGEPNELVGKNYEFHSGQTNIVGVITEAWLGTCTSWFGNGEFDFVLQHGVWITVDTR